VPSCWRCCSACCSRSTRTDRRRHRRPTRPRRMHRRRRPLDAAALATGAPTAAAADGSRPSTSCARHRRLLLLLLTTTTLLMRGRGSPVGCTASAVVAREPSRRHRDTTARLSLTSTDSLHTQTDIYVAGVNASVTLRGSFPVYFIKWSTKRRAVTQATTPFDASFILSLQTVAPGKTYI